MGTLQQLLQLEPLCHRLVDGELDDRPALQGLASACSELCRLVRLDPYLLNLRSGT